MRTTTLLLVFLAGLCQLTVAEEKAEREIDPATGMIIAENWELVRNNCIVCHSAKQFLRQRGTYRSWQSTIHWMQKKQGLWPFDAETENKILTYLSENYAPGEASRRPNLVAGLLPPNPYVSSLKTDFEKKRAKGEVPTASDVKGKQ